MDTKEKLIKDFVNSIRYAPTYKSYDDFTKMTEAFVEEIEKHPKRIFYTKDLAAISIETFMDLSPVIRNLLIGIPPEEDVSDDSYKAIFRELTEQM